MPSLLFIPLQLRVSFSRCITGSCAMLNWDKYAVGKTFHARYTKKLQTLDTEDSKKTFMKKSMLAFDVEDENQLSTKSSHTKSREKMIAEAIYDATQLLLSSNTISQKLSYIPIEITKVEMSPSLSNARIFWSLAQTAESLPVSEEEAEIVLNENIELIRSALPAYHSLPRSPHVTFYYDIRDKERKILEQLLHQIKKD